ncbi:GH19065 [Drosophila grimshawi]|uniref:GH19065 n=1 Tax=Drosophila grimshawi TaxID=7222 RepID=B4JIB2_DROGR|nr:GH19065 [Drosophila grimshawi]
MSNDADDNCDDDNDDDDDETLSERCGTDVQLLWSEWEPVGIGAVTGTETHPGVRVLVGVSLDSAELKEINGDSDSR